MKNPKISIITVSLNSERTIEDTILSVVGQDYGNVEYIVVDGKSTDKTLDIIGKYREKISVLVSEKDNGISDAFNKGVKLATGDIICIINSDDKLLPGALQKVAAEYDGAADIYCGNVLLWNEENEFWAREKPSVKFSKTPYFCHVAHQGMFITPECYRKYGLYDTRICFPMDLEFLIRASQGGAKFHYMDIDIAEFRNGGATGKSIFVKRPDYIYMVRKNGGNIIQAEMFYWFLVATQMVKRFLGLFGKNLGQRLRYGRNAKYSERN